MTNWTRTVGTVLMIVIAALASSLDVSANTRLRAAQNATRELHFSQSLVTWQEAMPAQLVDASVSRSRIWNGGVILNSRGVSLTSVRIGCVLNAAVPGSAVRVPIQILKSARMQVAIQGSSVGPIGSLPWYMLDLATSAKNADVTDVEAEFGIVEAIYADGATYTYNLTVQNGFRRVGSTALDDLYFSLGEARVDAAAESAASMAASVPVPTDYDLDSSTAFGETVKVCLLSTYGSKCKSFLGAGGACTGTRICIKRDGVYPPDCNTKCRSVLFIEEEPPNT